MDIPTASSFGQRQAGQHRHTLLVAPNQSLIDAMGLHPDTRLIDAGLCSPLTIRGGRRWVQLRSDTAVPASGTPVISHSKAALVLVPQSAAQSENQHQQADDHEKADQKYDADRTAEKLEHAGDSFGWVHLLRLGYRRIVQSQAAKADG